MQTDNQFESPDNVREYTKVTDEQRSLLIQLLESNITIKNAARRAGLKYENAKVIYRVYRKEGRATKKVKRRCSYRTTQDKNRSSGKASSKIQIDSESSYVSSGAEEE